MNSDACEAVTKDFVKVILERLSTSGEFNEEDAKHNLHQLLTPEYAHSINGTASLSKISHRSGSSIAAKRVEAAAELAAKEAQYKATQEEIKQKQKIRLMEEQHKSDLETQRAHLEWLQAKKDVETACARLDTYEREIKRESVPPQPQHIQPNGQSTDHLVPLLTFPI